MSQETVLVDYTNSSKESKPFLNTPIISTGVHNAVISGLSVPVSINFILDKKVTKPAIFWKYVLDLFHPKCFQEHLLPYPQDAGNPRCVYYQPSTLSTVGKWSSDGVQSFLNDDYTVTCLSGIYNLLQRLDL